MKEYFRYQKKEQPEDSSPTRWDLLSLLACGSDSFRRSLPRKSNLSETKNGHINAS